MVPIKRCLPWERRTFSSGQGEISVGEIVEAPRVDRPYSCDVTVKGRFQRPSFHPVDNKHGDAITAFTNGVLRPRPH
jgi:hypothetical protein